MKSFNETQAWNTGIQLLKEIQTIIKQLPAHERFELCKQMQRSATSILANFAEGYSRSSSADKANRYAIARGKCTEIHAFILMCIALNYITEEMADTALQLATEEGKMLTGYIQSQQSKRVHQNNPKP